MKFRVDAEEGKEPLLEWVPLVDSDDEGVVKQPSFILESGIATDEAGVPAGLKKELQPLAKRFRGPTEAAEEEWQKMFGNRLRTQHAIADMPDQTEDDSVDETMFSNALLQFYND